MCPRPLPDPASLLWRTFHRIADRLVPGAQVALWQVVAGRPILLTGENHPLRDPIVIDGALAAQRAITAIDGAGHRGYVVRLARGNENLGVLIATALAPQDSSRSVDLPSLRILADYARSTLLQLRLMTQITRAKIEWERTFDAVATPLLLITADYDIRRANRAAASVNGMTPQELVGKRCHQIFRGLPEPCPGCPLPRLMESGEPVFLELEHVLGERVHHAYFYPLLDEAGLVEAVVEYVLDVTHQHRSRQRVIQVQKARALGTMVAGIGHNFSNLLEAILGQAESLRERLEDPEALQELDALHQSARDAAELLHRLREFSQKGHSTSWADVDMNRLVQEVVGFLSLKGRQPEIRVAFRLGTIPAIQGSALELKEVLLNLLLNALDAMPSGGMLTITTRALNEEGSQPAIELQVQDSGVGMPDDVRLRAFDPFFTTKEEHGTGLGLAVSYGIIRRHGGTIDCQSQLGRGTSFTLTLPVNAPTGSIRAEQAAVKPRVLVADDDERMVATLTDMLHTMGCDVISAQTGHEALSLFTPGAYDLVFTDLAMPDISGMQVAKAIRELDRTVPIVLVSGWGQHNLEEQLAAYHVTFLGKPFSLSRVQSIVAEAVGLRELRPEELSTPVKRA